MDVEIGLLGIKAVDELDSVIVLLSFSGDDQVYRLTGSCPVNRNPLRAAAIAVLNATNRLIERIAGV